MKRIIALSVIGLMVLSITAFTNKPLTISNPTPSAKVKTAEGGIQWLTVEEMEKAQKKEKRKVVVDVYTDWCGWCKQMDKATFADPKVAEYINKNFYAVKFNAEGYENIIFQDRVYKFVPSRKSHELANEWMGGAMSYPTTVYLDEKLRLIGSVPGFFPAQTYTKVLQFFEEGVYKKKDISLEAYISKAN
jgi:thioredoxin-related protein